MVLTSTLISSGGGVGFARQVHALVPGLPCMVIPHLVDCQRKEDAALVPPCLVHQKSLSPGQVMELVVHAQNHLLTPF